MSSIAPMRFIGRCAANPATRSSWPSSSRPSRSPVVIGERMNPGETAFMRTPAPGELARRVTGVAEDRALRRRVRGAAGAHRCRDRRHVHDRSAAGRPASPGSRPSSTRTRSAGSPAARGPTSPRWCPTCRGRRPATMPALLTSTSSRPSSSRAVDHRLARDVELRHVADHEAPVGPGGRTSSTTARPRGSSTSTTTTRAPSAANRTAVARPKPDAAPVTIATLPSSRPTSASLSSAGDHEVVESPVSRSSASSR